MSLTSFIKLPEIKQRLIEEYQMPLITCKSNLLVPPRTKSYGLTGTAFDYLLRFWLHRLNPRAETKNWVAETAVAHLDIMPVPSSTKKIAKKLLKDSKQLYLEYLQNGEVTDDVIRTTVYLAQLDPIYRAEYLDPNLGVVEQPVIDELRDLLTLASPDEFCAKSFCALNPVFGEASRLVGGADADIVIDDLLIDIKTIQSSKMDISQFHQLVGYFILSTIGGVNGKTVTKINRLGIYFSRYGELITFPSTLLVNNRFPKLVKWFKDKATEISG